MYTFLGGTTRSFLLPVLKYPVDATRHWREHEYYVEVVHDTRSQRSKICEIYMGREGRD